MSSENPSFLQGSSTFENSKIDSIKGFDSSNQNKVLFQSSTWLSDFSNKENSIPNYYNFLNQEKNKERDDTNIYNQLGFDSEESKYENQADNKMQSPSFADDNESFKKIFSSSNFDYNSSLKDESSIIDNFSIQQLKSEKNEENNEEINDENFCNLSAIDESEFDQREKDEMRNDSKIISQYLEKTKISNDKPENLQAKEILDKIIESDKNQNINSYNNEINNRENKNIIFKIENPTFDLSNKNNNINSITKDNNKFNNLLNKKRKDALNKVENSLKSKKKPDKIVVIIDEKYKLDLNEEDIKQSEEFKILRNTITFGNKIYFKKNEEQKYMISFNYENPNETEKLDEAIDKKNNIVKEKIKKIKKDIKDSRKLYDIRRGVYREFKNYLMENIQKYELYNDFWNDFFKQKEKDIELSSPMKGIKFNFPSFNHNLMKYLFFNERNSDLYEEFLKDKDFHKNYCEKENIHPNIADDFYRKNFHKIYCDKYKEYDLD